MNGNRFSLVDQLAYYRGHPPRCTRPFAISNTDLPDVAWDGHGQEMNTVFALACRCGNRYHGIHGYKWRNPDFDDVEVVLSPIELSCTACKSRNLLIDTNFHGYDPEMGHSSGNARGRGTPTEVHCDTCDGGALQVYIRFEYPKDHFDGGVDHFPGGKEDLFTWVSVAVHCPECGSLSIPIDFECA